MTVGVMIGQAIHGTAPAPAPGTAPAPGMAPGMDVDMGDAFAWPTTLAVDWGIGLLVFGVFGLVLLGAALTYWYDRKRLRAVEAWAHGLGWSFDAGKRYGFSMPFDLFDKGESRWSRRHASGSLGEVTPGLPAADADVFEYHYSVSRGSTRNRRTTHYYWHCVAVRVAADLGRVMIRDEHFGDAIAEMFGFDDIDMEDPEFSRRFVVKAHDRKDAYDLIGHGMMRYLVGHRGWRTETAGGVLFVYARGRLNAEQCARLSAFVSGLLGQLPRTLVNAARASRGEAPVLEAGAAASASRSGRSA